MENFATKYLDPSHALTMEQAEQAVQEAESAFGAGDIARMLAGFTDDVVVQFAEQHEMRGKAELEKFLVARMKRQMGYRLTKKLRLLMGNLVGVEWTGQWTDKVTGKHMEGRGCEFWVVRDGLLARWDAVFNVWDADAPRVSAIT